MASTYKPSDAISFAKIMIKSMPIDTVGTLSVQIADYIASLMWNAAPWVWTLGDLPSVSLVAGQTEYAVTLPTDFLYLNKANVSDGNQTNELKIVSALPAIVTQIGNPTQVASLSAGFVRISPKPTTAYAQTLTMIYKKQPPKIDALGFTEAGFQIFPDCYFPVYQEGVLWLAYQYADDQRAGVATVDQDGKTQYTQQLGVFNAAMAEMRRSEKILLDYPQVPVLHG